MARNLTVKLAGGNSIVVRSLPLRKQGLMVGLVADIVRLLTSITDEDTSAAMAFAAEFIEGKFDKVVDLIENSLVDENDIDIISGLDDTVEVLMAIYEANGGKNLLSSLGSKMGGITSGLQAMVQEVAPTEDSAN